MKNLKLLLVLGAVAVGGLVGCDTTPDELETVRVGLHANLGAGAGYSALNQGFMREEGINMVETIGAGPALATSVVEGNLDVSFMGGGVAWNYFTTDPSIKIVALDNLTDDDRLIAKLDGKGANLTLESSLTEIGNALKGATVAFDATATPATFWSSLVAAVNGELAEGSRIWYEGDEGSKLPNGLTDADYVDANKVTIVNVTNANISTSAQSSDWDFVIAFAPVATQLERDTANFKTVCKTSTHMADSYAPSTWAVNVDWLETHEETFKKFMRALVKGMNYRHDNPAGTCEDIEVVSVGQVSADSLETDIAIWLNAEQQLELHTSGDMLKYVDNIRNAQLSGANADKVDANVTAALASDFTYLVEACNALK